MIGEKYIRKIRVVPGKKVSLLKFGAGWAQDEDLKRRGKEALRERAREILEKNRVELAESQELLWASNTYALLIILQGMDTSGKDGTIKHVMSGVNPQGCLVHSFRVPTEEELDHDFLWRYYRKLPGRGEIGVFNRSYYEDVVVVRVRPELLLLQNLPPGKRNKDFWEARYQDINAFEQYLVRNGTVILKFFLHISKDEQKERLLARLDNEEKLWKFSMADLADREAWDDYIRAYEIMLQKTSTEWAPWYVIPADYKWAARTLVAEVITKTIASLDLRYPRVSPVRREELMRARERLVSDQQ
ncbi:MAG: polyphosphate kinase 2 family protein [Methanoregulaceae archaeon]